MSEVLRAGRCCGAAAMTPAFAADYRIIDPHVHVWKHDPQYPVRGGARVRRRATPRRRRCWS